MLLERLFPRIKEDLWNYGLRYAPQSPSGVVVELDIDGHDPSRVRVVYAGGLKKVKSGTEVPLFEEFLAFTDQIQAEGINPGDFVRVDTKQNALHRVGTPEEIKERWHIDVTQLAGWKPPSNGSHNPNGNKDGTSL